jgi:hypothetical protein
MASHLARVRKICLGLPQATEVEAWGSPTFRIGRIFAMYAAPNNHHGDGREGIWVKSSHFTQDLLVRGQPMRYFKPPYVGPSGWVGVYLDRGTDWIALTELLRDSYRQTAPKKLAALVPDDDGADRGAAPPRKAGTPRKPGKLAAKKKRPAKRTPAKRTPATPARTAATGRKARK